MKKAYEIEIKWQADHVKRHEFLDFMTQQIKKAGTTQWQYITVFGPDYYWKTDDSWVDEALSQALEKSELLSLATAVDENALIDTQKKKAIEIFKSMMPVSVLRNRVSEDSNELTAKARLGDRHIIVRQEENVPIDSEHVKQRDIDNLIHLIGMKKTVTIKKDCDIFTIKTDDGAKVDAVWYETFVKGFDNRVFIEVEVSGVSEDLALEILTRWKNQLRFHLKLTDNLISDQSLYEIFTGESYKRV